MHKTIIYFHGYGSSPLSTKVGELKKAFPDSDIFAPAIDIDYRKAFRNLLDFIDEVMVTDLEKPTKVIFIGTSLGAYWAAKMASIYAVKAILINPSVDPSVSLVKYGLNQDTLVEYEVPFTVTNDSTFFFAEKDEILDHSNLQSNLDRLGVEYHIDPDADHRFGGDAFDKVIEHIKSL